MATDGLGCGCERAVRLALSSCSLGRFPSRFGRKDLGPSSRVHAAAPEPFRCRPHDERNIPVARSLTGLDQFGHVRVHNSATPGNLPKLLV